MNTIQNNMSAVSNLVDLVIFRARISPNKTAFIFVDELHHKEYTLTYKQLELKAMSIAALLSKKYGLKKGDRAILLYPPGIDFITGFFGCLFAGIIAVPNYPPFNQKASDKLLHVIENCTPSIILTNSELSFKLKSLKKINFVNRIPILNNVLKKIFKHSSTLSNWAQKRIPIAKTDQPYRRRMNNKWIKPDIQSEDLAFLQYTSGSTGNAKGVMVTHANLINNLKNVKQASNANEQDIMVSWLPSYHDMGLINCIIQPIFSGFLCVFISPFTFLQKPFLWLKLCSDYKATVTGGPNFAFDYTIKKITEAEKKTLDLSNMRIIFNGAEPIHSGTLKRFADYFEECGFNSKALFPCYGLAEGTLFVSCAPPMQGYQELILSNQALKENRVKILSNSKDEDAYIIVSSGIFYEEVKIVNPDTLRACGQNEIGEIWLRGPSVTAGYWENVETTKEIFQAEISGDIEHHQYLRTGDLGFIHADQLYITGRIKDLIILKGSNHYPQDIENTVLNSNNEIRLGGCVAFSLINRDGERLALVCELKSKLNEKSYQAVIKDIQAAVLKEHSINADHIWLVPARSIHKTTSGKVQRRSTRHALETSSMDILYEYHYSSTNKNHSKENTNQEQLLPNTDSLSQALLETWMKEWIARKTNIPASSISSQTEILDYGLDSIAIIQFADELNNLLNTNLDPTIGWDFPTIEKLSVFLASNNLIKPGIFVNAATEEIEPTEVVELPQKEHDYEEKLRKAAIALVEMQSKLDSRTSETKKQTNKIAIIGASCRFPGHITSLDDYWQVLSTGKDCIVKIPEERFSSEGMYSKVGGFIDSVYNFDPSFFGISPKEAISMDPQQRLVLEIGWEALEAAVIAPKSIQDSKTGVFIGVATHDYIKQELYSGNIKDISDYSFTGTADSILAARLAYFLDLHGPCVTIDTACSSSLVAIHAACQSLASIECNLAIAGGVNLMLSEENSIFFCKVNALSKQGFCNTFDDAADGYVRGEGCGIVILKRLDDAIANNDNILAVINASGINQDGRSNGITAPNGLAQEQLLQEVLNRSGVDVDNIDYIETHGTGTKLGDPIEIRALTNVYAKNRIKTKPILIGSVKTQIGHLEAAAGVASIIKVCLSMQKQQIPATIHLQKLNTNVDWNDIPIKVPTALTAWQNANNSLYAAISSFGLSGTNAHVVLESFQNKKIIRENDSELEIFTLSAKSIEALKEYIQKYIQYLSLNKNIHIRDICLSTQLGKDHMHHRLAFVINSTNDINKELQEFSNTDTLINNIQAKPVLIINNLNLELSSQIAQIYKNENVFKEELTEVIKITQDCLNIDLKDSLFKTNDKYNHLLEFIHLYALSKYLLKIGISPKAKFCNTIGAFVGCGISEMLTLHEAIELLNLVFESKRTNDISALQQFLNHITFKKPNSKIFIANIDIEKNVDQLKTASYWLNILNDKPNIDLDLYLTLVDCNYFISISPETSVQNKNFINILGTHSPIYELYHIICTLYMRQVNIKWDILNQGRKFNKVILPSYPFQRKEYRHNTTVNTATKEHVLEIDTNIFYQRTWQTNGVISAAKPDIYQFSSSALIVFCQRNSNVYNYFSDLRRQGFNIIIIIYGHKFQKETDTVISLDSSLEENLVNLIELCKQRNATLDHLLLFFSEYIPSTSPKVQNPYKYLTYYLALLQTMEKYSANLKTQIYLLCNQLHKINSETNENISQALLWGLSKVACIELNKKYAAALDLETNSSNFERQLNYVLAVLSNKDLESEIVLRNDNIYVSRINRLLIEDKLHKYKIHTNGVYIITGGLGGLGLAIANWLVQNGAKELVLITRNIAKTVLAQDTLNEMNSRGVIVHLLQADISDEKQFVEQYYQLGIKNDIKGIFHAAGNYTNQNIFELNAYNTNNVIKPKVNGLLNILNLVTNKNLDFIICFSSIAAVWGARNYAHYAAANYFMDTLANTLPKSSRVISIDWGPWDKIGMAMEENRSTGFINDGIMLLNPDIALNALEAALQTKMSNIIIADINWHTIIPFFTAYKSKHVFDNLQTEVFETDATPIENNSDALKAIESIILRQAVDALHLGSTEEFEPNTDFLAQGMDSITAVHFCRELSKTLNLNYTLPSQLIFIYPTVHKLANYLLNEISANRSAIAIQDSVDKPQSEQGKAPIIKPNVKQFIHINNINNEDLPPIFFIHSGLGDTNYSLLFTNNIQRKCYGINFTPESKYKPFADLVSEYIAIIKSNLSKHELTLVGYSFGATVAWHIAKTLEDDGYIVNNLILLDAPVLDIKQDNTTTAKDLFKKISAIDIIDKIMQHDNDYSDYKLNYAETRRLKLVTELFTNAYQAALSINKLSVDEIHQLYNYSALACMTLDNIYTLPTYNGKVTMFIPYLSRPENIELVKQQCATAPDIIFVPGNHFTMVYDHFFLAEINKILTQTEDSTNA